MVIKFKDPLDIDQGNRMSPKKSGDYYPPSVSLSNNIGIVRLINVWSEKDDGFRRKCGCDDLGTCDSESHGDSYAAADYNHDRGPGKYKIKVAINHYGIEYYGTGQDAIDRFNNAPRAYHLWSTKKLDGPNSPGREKEFESGNNDTPLRHTGALALEVFDKNDDNSRIWWALWYFENGWGDWHDQWLRCGHNYGFQFVDD